MSWQVYLVSDDVFYNLKNHNIPIKEIPYNVYPNEGVTVMNNNGDSLWGLYEKGIGIRKINDGSPNFKSSPNRDLALLNDFLKNPKITTIFIDGFFGTGKTATVMSHLVAGLEDGSIPKAIISKPHISLGKSYGHLPGELEDKLHHEFTSYFQYFDRFGTTMMTVDRYMARDARHPNDVKLLEAMPFEYLRGRNVPDGWVILDEAQNTDTKEIVSFITRMEDNAKVIILGDTSPLQMDRPSVGVHNNGLAFALSVFKEKSYTGVVNLQSRNHIIRGTRVKDMFDAVSALNK